MTAGRRLSRVLYHNGINAATGGYLSDPRELTAVAAEVVGPRSARPSVRIVRGEVAAPAPSQGRMSLIGADDSHVDARTGWGVVFADDESDEVRRALEPLLAHRRSQAGGRFRILEPYVKDCAWADWLGAHDAIPGVLDTSKIPYYIAVVGGPDRIPWGFQYLLDVEYAVGRIAFDTADEYAAYAESVVRYETADQVRQGKWAGFFGTAHEGDGATQGSAEHLITPLAAEDWVFRTRSFLREQATKANLMGLLHGEGEPHGPAVVFSATHGAAYPFAHPHARERNGALVTQDWPGIPPGAGPNTIIAGLKKEHFVSSLDITEDARIHGMIGFHFACFGAGTPQFDNFATKPGQAPILLTDRPFVARLPQKMMAHPKGGALAVIGHVDRVWSYSFQTSSAGDQIGPFRETIRRLGRGQSVGRAMKEFNERFAALCVYLVCIQQRKEAGQHMADEEYAALLAETNDAQGYVILGDPAVKLRVAEIQ